MRRHAKAASAPSTDRESRTFSLGAVKRRSAGMILVSAMAACAALIALGGVASAEPPVVVLDAPTNPTYTTVEVSGEVNPQGGAAQWGFEISDDGGATWNPANGQNVGGYFESSEPEPVLAVAGTIEGLRAGAAYKVRLSANNFADPTVFSPEREFTTEAVPAPTVNIDPVSTHTDNSAELNGSITANSPAGNPDAAAVQWHFVCSPGCDISNQGTVDAGQSEAVHATATGLQPNTEYTITLVGENAGGSVTAGPVSFTTTLLAPEAETLPTMIVPREAGPKLLLRGSVDPNNAPAEYWFEYGLTTAYGQTAPAAGHADAGSGRSHTVMQEIAGLAPSTTYHYKLVTEGPGGPSVGADMEFTTAPAADHDGCFSGCRAYEMVSPSDKNGGDIGAPLSTSMGTQAAADGNSIIYLSQATSFGDGNRSGSFANAYRAVRGEEGWITTPLLPGERSGFGGVTEAAWGASADLSRLVVSSLGGQTTEGLLTEPSNLLMIDAAGSSTVMTAGQQPTGFAVPYFDGGSADLSRVVFTDTSALTPDAPTVSPARESRGNLYGWTSTGLRVLDVLPDGTIPSQGAALGSDSMKGFLDHAISTDASRVFFSVADESGSCPTLIPQSSATDCFHIYLRDDAFGPAASTVELTANAGGPDVPGVYPAKFSGASADGTRAFFTSPAQLTPDATTGASRGGNDLYEYRLGEGLTDLTVDHGDANGANVLGVTGVSDDGASVYFVAEGQLDGNQGVAGRPNLYLHRDGEPIRFIATLAPNADDGVWDRGSLTTTYPLASQMTPDGDHLVFVSSENSLAPQTPNQPAIYEYSVDTGLTCVSCDPSGAASVNPPSLPGMGHVFLGNPMGTHQGRVISDDGSRVFFQSSEPLVPQDSNGRIDVYVFEDGAPHLISTGRDTDDSKFVDSTPSGDDLFFLTREQLSGDDVDTNKDLYDARIGGRTVRSHVVAPSCQNEECRGATPTPPTVPSAATSKFSGAGNPKPPPPLTRAQKLRRALKACKSKHGKAKRKHCKKAAKKRFGKSGGTK